MEDKVLTVSKNSWHGRTYLRWKKWAWFKNHNYKYQENLCHYMRVIAFWSWIQWYFIKPLNNVREAAVLFTPFTMSLVGSGVGFGIYELITNTVQSLIVVGAFIGGVAAIIGITLVCILIKEWWQDRPVDENAESSSFKVAYTYLRAKKHKICPFIIVNGD